MAKLSPSILVISVRIKELNSSIKTKCLTYLITTQNQVYTISVSQTYNINLENLKMN